MSNGFPEISNEPWQRRWLLLQDWQRDPGWESGFMGITGSSPSTFALLNAVVGNDSGPRLLSLEQVLEETTACRALVLLGRPDAGKSHELLRFHQVPGTVLIQAKEIGEALPQHLDRVIRDAANPLTLIFDSLDECLIDHSNALGSLFLWLRHRDERLGFSSSRLVLTCRWAES